MYRRSAIVNVMAGAARKAARKLVRDFGEVEQLQVSKKGVADFVTNADLAAERTLREELHKARPEFGLLMEEGGESGAPDAPERWIVDPLDGTLNYMHGIPHFAISIALERRGEIVAGLVYEPVHDEMFWAEKGGGAYLNDRRLRVSSRSRLEDCVIATGIPFLGRKAHARYAKSLEAVMNVSAGIRRFGVASLDLAWVAAGRFDGFWEFSLSPWDIAAGLLIVREAGGYATDISGHDTALESGDILAANDHIHSTLGRIIREAIAE
jgi:myo-inositol-1(or 4)-monophosphatase